MAFFNRVIVLVWLLTAGLGQALGQLLEPSEPLRLRADCSRYRGDESNLYIEVYYSFAQRGITYQADSGGFKGALDLTVVATKDDSMTYGSRWLVPHSIKDTSELKTGMNLVGVASLALGSGEHLLKVIGRDANNSARVDSLQFRVPVRMLDTTKVVLSDLELATSIREADKKGPFYKNTLEVIPNVDGVFTDKQRCFVYAEAYHLLSGHDRSDLTQKIAVFDAIGREVISRDKVRRRVTESNVVVDQISVGKLRTGTYSVIMALLDTANHVLSSSGKKFYVYNSVLGVDSSIASSTSAPLASEYATMSEEELDKEFDWARYAEMDQEKDQYKQLSGVEAKRKFMSDFWRRRPLGFKEEYLNRVSYANTALRTMGREGFKTDRGRVYIVYGPPDDYDRHPSDPDSRPYEIWTYHSIQGGVLFAFVLRQTGGDYELVHSTHRNELHDDNWMRFALTQ